MRWKARSEFKMKNLTDIYSGLRNYLTELDKRGRVWWNNISMQYEEDRRLKDVSRMLK